MPRVIGPFLTQLTISNNAPDLLLEFWLILALLFQTRGRKMRTLLCVDALLK